MTAYLLQNVVKLLQSKICAKLLQEGAYWRGASTLCTKVGVHCTQLHTGTKLHRSTKQKCTTRLVHRHQFNLMPQPCLQRKSGIRKENLRARLFPQNFWLQRPLLSHLSIFWSHWAGDDSAGQVAIGADKEMDGALAVFENQLWFQVWVAGVCH